MAIGLTIQKLESKKGKQIDRKITRNQTLKNLERDHHELSSFQERKKIKIQIGALFFFKKRMHDHTLKFFFSHYISPRLIKRFK